VTTSNVGIWVSAGDFISPFYKFYADSNGKNELIDLALKTNKKYVFRRLNNSTSHPFFITDRGLNQQPSNALILKGDGSVGGGIKGYETFSLEFSSAKSDIESLLYYCTSHSSMQDELNVQHVQTKGTSTTPDSGSTKDSSSGKISSFDKITRPPRFKRKFVDILTNFNPVNDFIEIDTDSFGIDFSSTFKSVRNSKLVKKKLAKKDFDFLYDEKKGGLYFNENGADKGFGEGGIIAILKGAPELTANNLEFI
jgi:hypothetical protein